MLKQWPVFFCLAGIVVSTDFQSDPSIQLPVSSSTIAPLQEIKSTTRENVPIEAQILQKPYVAQNSGTRANPGVSSVVTTPGQKVEVKNYQHVTVQAPTANHISSIPVPVIGPPLRHNIPVDMKSPVQQPLQYVLTPVGYSQVFQNSNQDKSVYTQGQMGDSTTSKLVPVPISTSASYKPTLVYLSAPTGIIQPTVPLTTPKKETAEIHQSITGHTPRAPSFPAAISPALHPDYHRIQGIVSNPGFQLVSVPDAQIGHRYKTVLTKPVTGTYLTPSMTILTPLKQEKVIPQAVKYVSTPLQHVVYNRPVNIAPIKHQQPAISHRPAPVVAPIYNVRVKTDQNSHPLFNPAFRNPATIPKYSALSINHRGLPHYVVSSAEDKPIRIPVIYRSENLPSPQIVGEAKKIQSTPVTVSDQVPLSLVRLIPVSLASNVANIRDDRKTIIPVMYIKSIAEEDRGTVKSKSSQVLPEDSRSRAIVFSPASKVSRVSFSGNGINYSW